MPPTVDDEALRAAVDLVARSGARAFELGYLHDDVPVDEAGWWATATYRGVKIGVEDQAGPVEAAEGLAERILTGGMCAGCGGLVALRDDMAFAFKSAHLVDGSSWTVNEAAAAGQCRWRRRGAEWVRGCDGKGSGPAHGPNRAERRKRRRR